MKFARIVFFSVFFFLTSTYAVPAIAETVGIPAKGGFPEYLFIDKVSRSEATQTAALISKALAVGRLVIFSHMGKLTDPNLGDKGFNADYFEVHWRAAMESDTFDLSLTQHNLYEKLVWAGKQSIANNQERLNVKGVKWKHFLPAKWARETGLVFNSRTGIVTKQPSINYRHPSNVPDEYERKVLKTFIKDDYDNQPHGKFTTMGKQAVYRYMEPVRLMAPCLSCHGKPKGELDMLGFEKDGLEKNDVIGMISVTLAVE